MGGNFFFVASYCSLLRIRMCWNKDVSLNTFLFGCFALALIYYSSHWTPYALPEFENEWAYPFMISVIAMQLIEYFLWISIEQKDRVLNYWGSVAGLCVIMIQPILALMLLPASWNQVRNASLAVYTVCATGLFLFRQWFEPIRFTTGVGKDKHLDWIWLFNSTSKQDLTCVLFLTLYFFFFGFPLLVAATVYGIIYLGWVAYLFMTESRTSVGSQWCWVANTLFFIFLFRLLFVLPYCTMPFGKS